MSHLLAFALCLAGFAALAFAMRYAKEHNTGSILVNLSGRGDKDIDFVEEKYGYGDQFFK